MASYFYSLPHHTELIHLHITQNSLTSASHRATHLRITQNSLTSTSHRTHSPPHHTELTYLPITQSSLTSPSHRAHSPPHHPELTHLPITQNSLTSPSHRAHSPPHHPELTHLPITQNSLTSPSHRTHSPPHHTELTHLPITQSSLTSTSHTGRTHPLTHLHITQGSLTSPSHHTELTHLPITSHRAHTLTSITQGSADSKCPPFGLEGRWSSSPLRAELGAGFTVPPDHGNSCGFGEGVVPLEPAPSGSTTKQAASSEADEDTDCSTADTASSATLELFTSANSSFRTKLNPGSLLTRNKGPCSLTAGFAG